ncbi:hypothetical protein E1A91_D02G125500v1 [Gossypium mustelinum]|uniref:START domain-containing protein n=1 Tax=Gossypium mustelinum TaxID=34275 RepID=A0A5D2VV71_GOSMU|nr:hypothetical protein E1A91_D02G125500v1 [Gossypium mustelinum]
MGVNLWGCEGGKMGDKFYVKFLTIWTSPPSSLLSSTLHLPSASSPISNQDSQSRTLEVVSDSDLKFLIDNLDEKRNEDENWENVIDKKNNFLSYKAKCCKSKDRPLKYLSTAVFESCSPELLRDFYMDNDYRKQWDKTILDHVQLQVYTTSGVEIGRTLKKFPLLTPREYILAWRLWEGKDTTLYCFIKDCEHPSAPRQKKYVRVEYFRSGWQIRKGKFLVLPGRDASEIRMFHQEDAGLNVEMAKLAFAKGAWSFLCKMDNALRNYSSINHPPSTPSVSAATLIQKVPPDLDYRTDITSAVPTSVAYNDESRKKKLLRRPSKKFLAKALLLLGGVIYLCRAHSALGTKVTMACILTKLRKRDGSSRQSSHS